MARCRWDEARQRWTVEHLEWAGNLVRCVAGACAANGASGQLPPTTWEPRAHGAMAAQGAARCRVQPVWQ